MSLVSGHVKLYLVLNAIIEVSIHYFLCKMDGQIDPSDGDALSESDVANISNNFHFLSRKPKKEKELNFIEWFLVLFDV